MQFDRGTIFRVWLPLLCGLVVLGCIHFAVPRPRGWTHSLGLFLALVGLGGVITGRYTLGRSFSITAKAQALVTTGIYSRIRNPIYVFGALFLVGISLTLGRIKMLAILVVLVPLQIVRARKEALVLEAKFGEAYREYRKRIWF